MKISATTHHRPAPRTIVSPVTALLFLLTGLLCTAGPASAKSDGLLDATCIPPSSSNLTYSPPLTNVPQVSTPSLSWQLGPCVSTSVPALTSGTATVTGTPQPRTCLELLSAGQGTRTIHWNTGATSTMSLNRTVTLAGTALVVTHPGTVTSGLFAGDTVVITETGVATDILLCTAGLGTVNSINNLITMEVTSV
ncbi:hypothetical protein EV562_101550 [Streptomyces sp. BK208]|uniref:hypothetical protein n=1 Tax=Streptomyces sp. BK208 TaxID=2512150 RepID=UPI00105C01E3|nr:hypothetical protein [Streptomyces sp. BK208]TDT42580.1 hypothetical protein EV562_101550 [Streptomyces sp. BK208]